jgi:uncharacterized membrane protein YbhN (UPF0104 family)
VAASALAVVVAVEHAALDRALEGLLELGLFALAGTMVCGLAVPVGTAAAWRSASGSLGRNTGMRATCRTYGLGSLANTFLPARAGDVLRLELFARQHAAPDARTFAASVAAAVAIGQSLVFAVLAALGAMFGAVPLWLAALCVVVPAALIVGWNTFSRRPEGPLRLRAWSRIVAWIGLAAAGRTLTAATLLGAASVAHPWSGALIAVGSRALGGMLPLLPGGAGGTAAATAFGLTRAGVDVHTALAVAVSLHLVETASTILFAGASVSAARAQPTPDSHTVVTASKRHSLLRSRRHQEATAGRIKGG